MMMCNKCGGMIVNATDFPYYYCVACELRIHCDKIKRFAQLVPGVDELSRRGGVR